MNSLPAGVVTRYQKRSPGSQLGRTPVRYTSGVVLYPMNFSARAYSDEGISRGCATSGAARARKSRERINVNAHGDIRRGGLSNEAEEVRCRAPASYACL